MSTADDNQREMIRRLRLGNLRKLLRDRCGYALPDDDAGREYLHELLLPISIGPHAAIKMPNVIETWAPWVPLVAAQRLIDEINQTPIRQRMPTAKQLGKRLRLTNRERERLRLWTIAAFNMTPARASAWRKAKDRARKRRLRQLRGSKSRAEYEASSVNRIKPWIAGGISRRTWYRRRGTSPSEVRLRKTADTLVQAEHAPPLQKRLSKGALAARPSASTKAEKPKRQKAMLLTQQPPDEINGHTCATNSNGWRRSPGRSRPPIGTTTEQASPPSDSPFLPSEG